MNENFLAVLLFADAHILKFESLAKFKIKARLNRNDF